MIDDIMTAERPTDPQLQDTGRQAHDCDGATKDQELRRFIDRPPRSRPLDTTVRLCWLDRIRKPYALVALLSRDAADSQVLHRQDLLNFLALWTARDHV